MAHRGALQGIRACPLYLDLSFIYSVI